MIGFEKQKADPITGEAESGKRVTIQRLFPRALILILCCSPLSSDHRLCGVWSAPLFATNPLL